MRRAALALAFAAAALAAPAATAAPCAGFTDVDSASAFCASVAWMRNRGITQGCTPTLYCPNDGVTRLQLAAFLERFATSMAAMHWVDANGAFVGRAAPGGSLELSVAGSRVLIPLAPVDPAGYGLDYDARFEFEGPSCSGRRYFIAKGGNRGVKPLAVVAPAPFDVNHAYIASALNPLPFVASAGDLRTGTLVCTELAAPVLRTARYEAIGPFALPTLAFPLTLR